MSKQKAFLILAVLSLCFAAVFVGSQFYFAWLGKKPPPAPRLKLAEIERIQIGQAGFPALPPVLFTLVKAKQGDETSWRIPDLGHARADDAKIDRFLAKVIEVSAQIGQGTASGTEPFDVQNGRFQIALYNGGWRPLFTLLIGSRRTEQGAFLVREEESAATYRTQVDLLEEMGIRDPSGEKELKIDPWLAEK